MPHPNNLDEKGRAAEQIVNIYGEALSQHPGMAKPKSLLKHSKDKIKTAIKDYMLSLKSSNKLSKELMKVLSLGYASIDLFIEDKDAELYSSVEKLKDNAQLPEELLNNYHSYLNNATAAMKANVEEIKEFILSLHK